MALVEQEAALRGTSDESVLKLLREFSAACPPRISAADLAHRCAVVDTESPAARVYLAQGASRVTVRYRNQEILPSSFSAKIKRCEVAMPLVVSDSNGIDRRIGVAQSIRVFTPPEFTLNDVERKQMGDLLCAVFLDDERGGVDLCLIDHAVTVYRAGRRTTQVLRHRYSRIARCEVGGVLQIHENPGTNAIALGLVKEIVVLDASSQG
ncbi:hypothetical protein [Corynebacterium tapiri]|uniref:Uncharacterized protein n=1 Tax=Corynebacterium tapiri TaxID=1448266 RepID=A0A5C4U4J8_9CORY|nr:hypothetical protein [Corynebacterium tapiri]TNL98579.1 hypothetical protein FHE74_05095 [Corynebacterium tapiri]